MMMNPISNFCPTCYHDPVLRGLMWSLYALQQQVKLMWSASDSTVVTDNLIEGDGPEIYIKDKEGRTSVMPTKHAFHDVWLDVMLQDPLDFNWFSFDVHAAADWYYLVSVYDILNEKIMMWGTDEVTVENPVFKVFQSFFDRIGLLFRYIQANDDDRKYAFTLAIK